MYTVDAFSAARFVSREALPYYRRMLYALIPHPVKGLAAQMPGTWAIGVTEDYVVYYDPDLWVRMPPLFLGAALVHEGLHPLRKHGQRARALGLTTPTQLRRWNIAGDCELNDDHMAVLATLSDNVRNPAAVKAYAKFLSTWVTPDQFGLPSGKTAEWYYRNLPEDAGSGKGEDGDEDGEDGQPGGAGGSGQPGDGDDDGDAQGQPQRFGGTCGSGAGNPHPAEPKRDGNETSANSNGANADGESGASPMPQGRSQREIDRIIRDVAKDVQEAQSGKQAGLLPGGILRWADLQLERPVVHWTTVLAQMLRYHTSTKGGHRYETYTRTSRRQASYGWGPGVPIMPGRVDPDADIDIVTDTSGSMTSGVDLRQAMTEVAGICAALPGTRFRFHSADAVVQASTTITSVMDIVHREAMKGGGGTDFCPFFEMVKQRARKPHGVVYITDGYGSWPSEAPPYPVIVVLTGPSPYVKGCPAWAQVVFADPSAAQRHRKRSAA